jgi:hypothetical protein
MLAGNHEPAMGEGRNGIRLYGSQLNVLGLGYRRHFIAPAEMAKR